MMRRRRGTTWGLLALAVAAAVALGAVLTRLAPHAQEARVLARLVSPHAPVRERAAAYVAAAGRADAGLVRAAAARAATRPEALETLAASLEAAGLWTPDRVPAEAWERWLVRLARSDDRDDQAEAARLLGEFAGLSRPYPVVLALDALMASPEARVRRSAVASAAVVASTAPDPSRAAVLDVLRGATADGDALTARQAWLFLGLLRADPLPTADWRAAPIGVAEAMLWAMVQSRPGEVGGVVSALVEPEVDPRVRAAAAYALAFSDAPAAGAALLDVVDVPPELLDPNDQLRVWRAILALPRPNLRQRTPTRLEDAIVAYAMDEGDNPALEPLALAAVHRMGIAGARRRAANQPRYNVAMMMATVEGQEPPYMRWPLTGEKPPLLRALTMAVDSAPEIGDLRPALSATDPPTRDLACVVAAEKFDAVRVREMGASLLGDASPEARASGAMLLGLAGDPNGLVARAMDSERDRVARAVMELADWMMDPARPRPRADRFTPRTTALLARLASGDRLGALDVLLAPRGQPTFDLVTLLAEHRWWYVLRPHLAAIAGDGEVPPLWIWGDARLQAFQADVLRNWYLLVRQRAGRAERERAPAEGT